MVYTILTRYKGDKLLGFQSCRRLPGKLFRG